MTDSGHICGMYIWFTDLYMGRFSHGSHLDELVQNQRHSCSLNLDSRLPRSRRVSTSQ